MTEAASCKGYASGSLSPMKIPRMQTLGCIPWLIHGMLVRQIKNLNVHDAPCS
ncbi:hypothetical protein RE6C_00213 [Rhodopirellula europaea 6C]|uniref:Uncharacterized protein n=1 Tax=Rhodopirellula europaea 6C TaxID=1263867 RepID=M2APT7_9BACT|nr:hypothetical protein RE6C_00213 [Rhodopirellula europaea 6C]